MSQWDYKIDQPMPGPFPFPIQEKALGLRLGVILYMVNNVSQGEFGQLS